MSTNDPNNGNNQPNINTSNLQQILAISTSLTNPDEHEELRPVDEERRKFFFESIQSIRGMQGSYQDDIEVIKISLEELRTHPNDSDRCSVALQNIMDLVDHIDVASDFMKLGGFPTVCQFLTSDNSELVRQAAEIVGIACQNHPNCQNAILEDGKIFQELFNILQSPKQEDKAKLKAVFAISSSIQNNNMGHDKFLKMGGYDILIQILKTGGTSLRLRICFVIDCLCSQFPQIKAILLEKQFINCLVDILTKMPVEESKETVLNTMLTFVEGFYDAVKECQKEEHNLKPTLDYLIAHYPDEFKEEKEKAIQLRNELDRFTEAS